MQLTRLEVDTSLERLGFTARQTIGLRSTGEVVLLDQDLQVVVLDPRRGSAVRLGRGGTGPGEFTAAGQLLVGPNDEIVVADQQLRRLTFFGSDLQYVKTVTVPAVPQQILGWSNDELIVLLTDARSGSIGPRIASIDLEADQVTERAPLIRSDSGLDFTVELEGIRLSAPLFAAAYLPDASVYVGEAHRYRILRLDPAGRVIGELGRPEAPVEYPSAGEIEEFRAKNRMFRQAVGGSRGALETLDRLEARFPTEPKPFFAPNQFTVLDDGVLLVTTLRGNRDSTYLDEFDASGSYRGTLSVVDKVLAVTYRSPFLVMLVERRTGEHQGIHGVDFYRVGELNSVP